MGGLTSIDTHHRTLADYLSAEPIELLQSLCEGSNKSTLGSHPSDRLRWMEFLLSVYRSGNMVDPDTFGALLEAAGWWPKRGIRKLVDEYELAMGLLRLNERTGFAV